MVNKLIPGGEIGLMPESTYTDKAGKERASGKRLTIAMGKQFISLRTDLAKALFEAILNDEEIQNFIGVSV